MEFLADMPLWLMPLAIFLLRIVDVSIGTVRTVSIIQGATRRAMLLGFFEIIVWLVAISQVLSRLHESWVLMIAYAAGFAAGNGVGILIERHLAMGAVVLRIITRSAGTAITEALQRDGFDWTSFAGEGSEGSVTLIYLFCARADIPTVVRVARGIDPDLFFVVESAREASKQARAVAYHTGWRTPVKKK